MVIDLYQRQRGVVFGAYLGDVLGMPFENCRQSPRITELAVVRSKYHGSGIYSDDTEMAIAVLEELQNFGEIDTDRLAERFANNMTPGSGYGTKTTQLLRLIYAGASRLEALELIYPDGGSARNGASMRVAPLGAHFCDDEAALIEQVKASALATHTHPEALTGALIQASAVAAAVRGEEPDEIFAAALEVSEGAFDDALAQVRLGLEQRWTPEEAAFELGNEISAIRSVPGSLYAALQSESFEEALLFAINMGGDTDTQAAMAGAIMGGRLGYEALDPAWLDALQDGPLGRSYVEGLCAALWAPPVAATV